MVILYDNISQRGLNELKNITNIIVFTDGSCKGNGKKIAKAGIGIFFPNKELDNIS